MPRLPGPEHPTTRKPLGFSRRFALPGRDTATASDDKVLCLRVRDGDIAAIDA